MSVRIVDCAGIYRPVSGSLGCFTNADIVCAAPADPCGHGVCRNGGTCQPHDGSFSCDCTDNYFGKTCQCKYIPYQRNKLLNMFTHYT